MGHQLLQLKDRSTLITSTGKNSNLENRVYMKPSNNMENPKERLDKNKKV